MGTLLIDRKDVELRREGVRLLVFEQGTRSGSIPLSQLDRVVIQNRASLDTGVLGALAEHGISLVVINPRRPAATAGMPGRSHNDAGRRIAQYRRHLDLDWRRQWSLELITRKLSAQRLLLTRALPERPDQRHALLQSIQTIEQCLDALHANVPRDLDQIRGYEGAGAAAYFSGFCSLFAPSLEFSGRNRRPPRDPVNACLSLGYTLLHSEAVLALHTAGLDPLLGFYHDLAYGRESLACDFVEPLRAHVDGFIWRLFRIRELRSEYFSMDKGACLLNKTGRKVFYNEWEMDTPPVRRALRRGARLLVKTLTGNDDQEAVLETDHDDSINPA